MYAGVLILHSILRWVLVGAALFAWYRAFTGSKQNRPFDATDKKLGIITLASAHTQAVLGFLLYGLLSPTTQAAFANFGAAMKDGRLRFYAVEHATLMFLSVIFIHVGHVLVKKKTGVDQHKARVLWLGLGILCILLVMPWPFRSALGAMWLRPLF